MTPTVDNIMAVYNHASLTAYRNGMSWYDDAHSFAASLDSDISRASGVIAAMSPLNGWSNNKRVAAMLYSGYTGSLGLSRNQAKAMRILSGEHPLDVLGGDKVRAFYATILAPDSVDSTPVVDRHAHDIAIGMRLPNKHPSRSMTRKRYYSFAETYSECARIIGIGAPQLQAITWLAWRERYGVEWYG